MIVEVDDGSYLVVSYNSNIRTVHRKFTTYKQARDYIDWLDRDW